jgi:hypothetical protein
MPVIRSSQFKITTIWPELVNKRLQTVTIQLKESQFIMKNDWVSIKGLLQRCIFYYDYDGRNRKTEDQLQFELMVTEARMMIAPDLLSIELQHDYFIFQPRYIGENQAIFEHGFTMIIHQAEQTPPHPQDPGLVVPVLANLITNSGTGNELAKGPVLFGSPGLKPELIRCELKFMDTSKPSIVSGVLHGFFSYRNPQNIRLEAEFEQPFSLCLKLPPLDSSQQFLITGGVTDGHWWFDPAIPQWQLEVKIDYSWRIVREARLNCLSAAGSTPECRQVKLPLFHQEKRLQIMKSFHIPAPDYTRYELNLCKPNLSARLTSKGILLEIDFLAEVYAAGNSGCECYQCHPVTDTELIAEEWAGDMQTTVIQLSNESEIKLIGCSTSEGELKVETVIECSLNLYQYDWLDLYLPASPTGYILGQVLKEQKTFSLSGSQILQLKARPLLIKELTISPIKVHPQIKPGWLHVAGVFQLAVTYLDWRQCMREDTYPVLFQETFLWDSLQSAAKVELTCRLEHNSYALNPTNPLRLNYCFWLHLTVESMEEQELPVSIVRDPLIIPSEMMTIKNDTGNGRGGRHDPQSMAGPSRRTHRAQPDGAGCRSLELEGEIPLKLGKAREIAGGRFNISNFNYRNTADFILVGGDIIGEIEYWDYEGYLRREQTGFSFWKCIRRSRFDPGNHRLIPGLNRFRYTLMNVPAWRKGRIKIQCVLELNPTNEEGVPL